MQVHFLHDMWENRADGKKKLKANAVPTVFGAEAKNIVSSKSQNTKKAVANLWKTIINLLKNYN